MYLPTELSGMYMWEETEGNGDNQKTDRSTGTGAEWEFQIKEFQTSGIWKNQLSWRE